MERILDKDITISNKDLDSGNLKYDSRIKPNKIFALEKSLIKDNIAQINMDKAKELVDNLNILIKLDGPIINKS